MSEKAKAAAVASFINDIKGSNGSHDFELAVKNIVDEVGMISKESTTTLVQVVTDLSQINSLEVGAVFTDDLDEVSERILRGLLMRYSPNATVRSEISTYDTGSEFVRALCSLTEEADTPLAVATLTSELYDIYADHDSLPSVIIKKAHVISRQLEMVSAGSGSLQNAHLRVTTLHLTTLQSLSSRQR